MYKQYVEIFVTVILPLLLLIALNLRIIYAIRCQTMRYLHFLSPKTTCSSGQDLPQKLFAQYPWSNQTDHMTRFTQVPTHIWPGHQVRQVIGGSSTSPTSSSPSSPSSSSATASSSSSSSTRSLMSVPALVSFKTGWLWILQVARTLRNLDCSRLGIPER